MGKDSQQCIYIIVASDIPTSFNMWAIVARMYIFKSIGWNETNGVCISWCCINSKGLSFLVHDHNVYVLEVVFYYHLWPRVWIQLWFGSP